MRGEYVFRSVGCAFHMVRPVRRAPAALERKQYVLDSEAGGGAGDEQSC
ncbi:MAG: hypothetical protein KatS3mg052_1239 [Candidatus Roseilinea sp.]|nr:MAG: hypothetical protein KatS3mg052_1239 [Candidatus Roseilinea sp.]